ncbi:MAG: hypothetical protein CM15mP18_3720 [Methanobacteriota archaeon]|nr:MAG: hypothetical protein CM15mP18_3720 [Euryarchaeota archaeon]
MPGNVHLARDGEAWSGPRAGVGRSPGCQNPGWMGPPQLGAYKGPKKIFWMVVSFSPRWAGLWGGTRTHAGNAVRGLRVPRGEHAMKGCPQ